MSRPNVPSDSAGGNLPAWVESAVLDDRGLIPVVVQDVTSGAVLMVAWADREALRYTAQSGLAHFFSRSRQRLWKKGETSGNELRVASAQLDCDRDTLLLRVHPQGPTCHTGERTCFEPNPAQLELGWLFEVLRQRSTVSPEKSYTASLLASGRERIAQKVGEEAVETVIAAVSSDPETNGALAQEVADLIYHLQVLLVDADLEPTAVAQVLAQRHSGTVAEATDEGDGKGDVR
ncbi:MAG: bifunctional phosphoribosyl-AMP cyclohydrolase/phosphoribosyl-ATP diphosphatase HisIE [Thermoanaerobaculia bacterium]|nr:bifunctional phosphoribosyl-AMP cyclohydrolase/phosphoribosyl-ATP diphosphatase HisIE [Thermoanaerobaculia bacterium]